MKFRVVRYQDGIPAFMTYTHTLHWQNEGGLPGRNGWMVLDTENPWHQEKLRRTKERVAEINRYKENGQYVEPPRTLH
jgi:hypothetical protein